jgi:hypothetical protein
MTAMNKLILSVITVFFICISSCVYSQESKLIVQDLYNENEHVYGSDVYVKNPSPYHLKFQIKMTVEDNIRGKLLPGSVLIRPYDTLYVGQLTQNQNIYPWEWKAQLYIVPVCDPKFAPLHPNCSLPE